MRLRKIRPLRVITGLNELCRWTFLQRLKVHHSIYGETDLRSAGERGTFVEERRDTNEEIITPYIYLGLLSVMWQENKRFHWTVLTVINTHFNHLQTYGWSSLAAHFQKSLFYLFDLYLVILMVVEMFHCISRLTDQTLEGRTLGGVVPMNFFIFIFFFKFCPQPPQESCEGWGHTRRDCRDQAQPRAAWF